MERSKRTVFILQMAATNLRPHLKVEKEAETRIFLLFCVCFGGEKIIKLVRMKTFNFRLNTSS